VKVVSEALFNVPTMVVLPPLELAEVNTGKFCSSLAPRSLSQISLGVTKISSFRSIPSLVFERMELAPIRLPVPPEIATPFLPLNAILAIWKTMTDLQAECGFGGCQFEVTPRIKNRLSRCAGPASSSICERLSPSASAITSTTASLALPFSATWVTATLSDPFC